MNQAGQRPFNDKTIPALVSIPSIFLYVITLCLGSILVGFTPIGRDLAGSESLQHLEFFFIFFPIPFSLNMLVPVVIALTVYAICLMIAWQKVPKYPQSLRRILSSRDLSRREELPNWLVMMPMVTSTLLVSVILLSMVQDALGVSTGGLAAEPTYVTLAGLTTSPISEEVCYRVTTLGLLVAIRVISSPELRQGRARAALESFLFPDGAKERAGLASVDRLGLKQGLHWSEWLMLTASSLLFGFAHISPGSTWGLGKVTTAALSGFVIGLAFLIYGAYASILIHWFFNYHTQIALIPLLGTDPVPVTSPLHPALVIVDDIVTGWSYFVGLVGLVLIAWYLLRKIRKDTSLNLGSGL